jgi:hypothetical protein
MGRSPALYINEGIYQDAVEISASSISLRSASTLDRQIEREWFWSQTLAPKSTTTVPLHQILLKFGKVSDLVTADPTPLLRHLLLSWIVDMEVPGGRHLGDLLLEDVLLLVGTLAIDPELDLKQIIAKNKGDGKKRGVVRITGTEKMKGAVRKIEAMQIRRGSAKRNVGVWRYAVVWRKIVFVRQIATPSVSLVSEPLQRDTVVRMKLVPEIAGHIDLRCSLEFPSIPLLAADPPM